MSTETLASSGERARSRRPLGAILRVLDARATPSTYALNAGSCSIGSSSACDLVIDDSTVSRNHVELDLTAEGVSVRDLGSRNGTYYLGQRVEKMVVGLGGRLTLGRVTIAIEADTKALEQGLEDGEPGYAGMLGETRPMRQLFALLTRLEGSLVPVLLEGESGVGKELLAHALHDHSSVATGLFVTVDCGAIVHDLVAGELFGPKTSGGFAGAGLGAFERADGGTLFLDDVSELPLEVQPVLLRALETGEIRAGERAKRVRVRILAASNRDLASAMAEGSFREDLFYRLAVVRLIVPPLRERAPDIPILARHFAEEAGLGGLPDDVLVELRARSWPGNVRELRNAIRSYAAIGLLPADRARWGADGLDMALSEFVDVARSYSDQKDALFERFTRAYLHRLMLAARNNQTEAARIAGLDRTYLRKLLAKFGFLD
ncbi:sigma 54-interacting transcriptional regulator [Pendulispora albinea]|uniref:Sigma 54-interacting transcriptional regulator n=1 Tax=Pendulispora albinea TaxID=2741071 RepID=A0ABZ2LLX9_9BACT